MARDSRFDRKFVYAVRTTGIYCRPSCPSRRPNPGNVHFYSSAEEAALEGFRPCLRCAPDEKHGSRAEKAVAMAKDILDRSAMDGSLGLSTDLKSLARSSGVSPFHLQRNFKRIVGLSPKAYLTKRKSTLLRENLRKGGTVLRATYESGFASPSAAYAAAGRELGMSPSTYQRTGAGTIISYWVSPSSVGKVIVAATERGVCAVLIGTSETGLVNELRSEFPLASIQKGESKGNSIVKSIVRTIEGRSRSADVEFDLTGTPFQWRVWQALRQIPIGETRSYGEIASAIGRPGAARAVGRACSTNRAAIVVPCHRVVRGDGKSGEYRWGPELKQRLLEREAKVKRE